jgi:hypothetical protein
MALRLEITCVEKTDWEYPEKKIRNIGGGGAFGRWKHSQQEAITWIEDRKCLYYVVYRGQEIHVIVASDSYGTKYLKTELDAQEPKILLALPDC